MLTYTVVLSPEPDDSAFTVTVPAMPGVVTWGSTVDEALASAREAIELHLEGFLERGQTFPPDRSFTDDQTHIVSVIPPVSAGRRSA